jgi:hypothetical protein
MSAAIYRYQFAPTVPFAENESSLVLAITNGGTYRFRIGRLMVRSAGVPRQSEPGQAAIIEHVTKAIDDIRSSGLAAYAEKQR